MIECKEAIFFEACKHARSLRYYIIGQIQLNNHGMNAWYYRNFGWFLKDAEGT